MSYKELFLNNYTNNSKQNKGKINKKRYLFNSKIIKQNEIGLLVNFNKRKFAYNELLAEDLIKVIIKGIKLKKFDFSIVVNGKIYNFQCVTFKTREVSNSDVNLKPTNFSEVNTLSSNIDRATITSGPTGSGETPAISLNSSISTFAPSQQECVNWNSKSDRCLEKNFKEIEKVYYGLKTDSTEDPFSTDDVLSSDNYKSMINSLTENNYSTLSKQKDKKKTSST